MNTLTKLFATSLLGVALSLSTLVVGTTPVGAFDEPPPQGPIPESTEAFWHADYFANTALADALVLSRDESTLYYNWGTGSPAPGIVPVDNFSARWIRNFQMLGGQYRFTVTADDGVRVIVDRNTILNRWVDESATTYVTDVSLTPGHHTITVEYYEHTGFAVMQFGFQRLTNTPPPVTEIFVDELSPGFHWSGPLSGRRDAPYGYAGHIYWTRNLSTGYINGGKWTPPLPQAGYWEAFAWIPAEIGNSRSVRYRTIHNGARDDAIINQNDVYNAWISLGTHYYNARNDGSEYIFVADNTGEPDYSRVIGFDAIKWVYRPGQP